MRFIRIICWAAELYKYILLKFKNLGLAGKLILSYVLILAVPIVAFGIYSFRDARNRAESDTMKNSLQALIQLKTYICRNIEICERAAQTVVSSRAVVEFISKKGEFSAEELIEFKRGPLANLEGIVNINPDIYKLRIFAGNPYLPEIWPSIYSEEYILKAAWRNSVIKQKGMTYWRLNHPEEPMLASGTDEIVSLYMELRYNNKEHIGILEVNMLAETFFGEMYNMLDDDNSFYCVVRDGSEIIVNKNNRLLDSLSINPSSLKEQLVNLTKGVEGNFTFKTGSKTMIVVYTGIEGLGCILYKVKSIDNVVKRLEKTRNFIFLGILGAIIVLSIVTYLITSVILKKMRIIIASMRKVQEGELKVDIQVGGDDEIGELGYHFTKMMQKINDLITVVVRKQAATKDAEIRALQTQINTHFVYNVLEAINMMAEIKCEYEISDTITSLGRLMRYCMSWKRQFVTLAEEVDHIRNYVTLLNVRYYNQIQLKVEIPDALLEFEILKMSLQPIVENAFNHGIEPKSGGGVISVNAYTEGRVFYAEVTDNGVGLGREELELLKKSIEPDTVRDDRNVRGTGIGLKNVNERIKLFYGKEYGLELESEKNIFMKVRVKLPFRE